MGGFVGLRVGCCWGLVVGVVRGGGEGWGVNFGVGYLKCTLQPLRLLYPIPLPPSLLTVHTLCSLPLPHPTLLP